MGMISDVIFDYHGVIERVQRFDFLRDDLGISESEIRDAHQFERSIRLKLDINNITPEEYLETIRERFDFDYHWDEYVRRLRSHATIDTELLAFIDDYLLGKYRLSVLSNNSSLSIDDTIKRFLFDRFPVQTYSHEVGMLKPNHNIYRYHLTILEANPDSCLFIDDKPDNVEAARNLNMKTLLFTDTSSLKKDVTQFLSIAD